MSNGKTAPPLTREELLPSMVTEADAFTALRYLRQREETPAIWGLEKDGDKSLPGTPAVLGDTYYSLWSEEPELKSSDRIPPSRQYWRAMLGSTMETSAFQELRANTRGDALLSMLGTIEAGRTFFGLVPKEDKEKLSDLESAQAEADKAESEAAAAQVDADAMGELAEQMMAQASAGGSGQPQSSGGQPQGSSSGGSPQQAGQASGLTAAQAQALADQLTEKWTEAQCKADAAKSASDAKRQAAQAKADALMGQPGSAEAEAKLRELTRIGLAAVKQANAQVQEVSDTIQGWGIEESELHCMDTPEALGLLEKMRQNASFKKFAALLGRLRAMAAKKARSKLASEGRRVTRIETGRDIARAATSELVSLAHPATRYQGLMRWARGELRLVGQETKQPLGHGPVIVCEDGSGSMDGAKQQWAKGVTLSLAHYAKLQKRNFGWLLFDYSVRKSKVFVKGALSAKDMLDLAESRAGGGTDFEQPLRKAVEMITKEGLKKADIVFVTDGDCAVSKEFLQWFLAQKKTLEFSVFTVLCDDGGHISDATVKQFSDRVERASGFTAEEAETKVFANL